MRAWQVWRWPSLKVLSSSSAFPPSPGLHPELKRCPVLITREGHDSSGSTPTLRGELRRLYKLIHPDFLHNQPVQQATNQKSFQLLQEYLSTARGGDGAKRYVYHFEFYIPNKASDVSLEKIEISLPPPQTRGRSSHEHEILPTTRKAIGKLFAACGLATNLSEVHERSSLPDLFLEASELQRQSEASAPNLQWQHDLISNALFIGRGVRVLFSAPVEETRMQIQVQLLQRMTQAMEECRGINFSGSTFVIGNCYKVDFLGRLWFNREHDVELWIQFLNQADLVTASMRRVAGKARQAKEEKVADLMGVELVFTHDSLALTPEYASFLNRLEVGAAEHHAVGGGRFSELPVRVSEVECPSVDERMGCITVLVKEDFSSVCKLIEQSGDKALAHRRKMMLIEHRLHSLRTHIRLKLRLRHLRFDRRLSPDQLMSACTRLSNHAPRLSNYTEGLSLCISDEHQLPSEASDNFVLLKWNFNLDEL